LSRLPKADRRKNFHVGFGVKISLREIFYASRDLASLRLRSASIPALFLRRDERFRRVACKSYPSAKRSYFLASPKNTSLPSGRFFALQSKAKKQ